MNEQKAQTAITISALAVTGMFAIRKVTEPAVKLSTEPSIAKDYQSVFGAAPPVSWGQFLKASGFLFITLAVVGAASPEIGGGFAVLIGTSAVLGNFLAIRKDLAHGEGETSTELEQQKALREGTSRAQPVSPAFTILTQPWK